ncbi:hypothetical protein ACFP3Q_07150 [Nocardioides sp. GCM10027113]|uniref:hypothetical protein n=1 Tax=unclassified Nocardioides TaxID=2615069 RepID=UPI003614FC8C
MGQEHEHDRQEGQVSEVSGMAGEPEPIAGDNAVAGYPDSESGRPQEGTAGPNASPLRGRPGREQDEAGPEDAGAPGV